MTAQPYIDLVTSKVAAVLSARPCSFQDLVRNCEGAFPTVVLSALDRISANYGLQRTADELLFLAHSSEHAEPVQFAVDTVEGNPVLSSWYFTQRTCARIAHFTCWDGRRLAFLGTPKLYEWFCRESLGEECHLLDLDPLVLDILSKQSKRSCDRVERYDARSPLPPHLVGRFDCVFVDPPWYLPDYFIWINRSLELAPAGQLYLGLLPRLTRPTAARDRDRILDCCRAVADELIIVSEYLDYEIPTFERAQLTAAGLGTLVAWKRADLLLLDHLGASMPEALLNTAGPIAPEHWNEVDIGPLRVFIAVRPAGAADRALLSEPPGSSVLLKSPSRREPERAVINVLTSRGHGLCTSEPEALQHALVALSDLLESGQRVSDALRALHLDSTTAEVLQQVLEAEG